MTDNTPQGLDPMPRKDVELPPRMPEAAIIAELRAELAQARADTDAAVALVVEEAVAALKPFADRVFYDNGDCTVTDTYSLKAEDFIRANRTIRALAPASGVAKLEALRAERDDARRFFLRSCEPVAASPEIADVVSAVEEWMNRRGGEDTADQIAIMAIQSYQRATQPERDRLAADLAASRAREARLVEAGDALDSACIKAIGQRTHPAWIAIRAWRAEAQAHDDASAPPDTTWHERRTMLPDGDARAVKARE